MEINEIVRINTDRAKVWHGEDIRKGDWNAADWSNAMAGEAGEVCNAVKKLRRHECGTYSVNQDTTREELIRKIALEVGDTFLYLALLCAYLDINMEAAIIATFNRVSIREGFPHRLPVAAGTEKE